MKRDDIICMAKEAFCDWSFIQFDDRVDGFCVNNENVIEPFERFATLVEQHLIESGYRKCVGGQSITQYCCMVEEAVKEEREACAKVCEDYEDAVDRLNRPSGYDCAAAIRARGET